MNVYECVLSAKRIFFDTYQGIKEMGRVLIILVCGIHVRLEWALLEEQKLSLIGLEKKFQVQNKGRFLNFLIKKKK